MPILFRNILFVFLLAVCADKLSTVVSDKFTLIELGDADHTAGTASDESEKSENRVENRECLPESTQFKLAVYRLSALTLVSYLSQPLQEFHPTIPTPPPDRISFC